MYVLPETHLQLLICIDHQASTAGRWQMAKLFYIPSTHCNRELTKSQHLEKASREQPTKAFCCCWNAQQEELRRILEMQSKALGASE
jgi:hypothetical protein